MPDTLQVSFISKNTRASYKPVVFNKVDRNERTAKLEMDRIDDELFSKAMKSAKLAVELAKTGSDKNKVFEAFKEALETADAIKNRIFKNGTIWQISSRMNEAGLNNNEIIALFKEVKVIFPD